MTDKLKPTPEQIQRACDLANAGGARYIPQHYGLSGHSALTALADTIARLDAMQAECDKARAALGEIERLLIDGRLSNDGNVQDAAAIAALYRVETDPLVEAAESILQVYGSPGSDADTLALIAVALKRGLEIGRSA